MILNSVLYTFKLNLINMHSRYFIFALVAFASGNLFSQNGTLNQTDDFNCKTGYWRNYKTSENDKTLIDEGIFVNGRKTGLWNEYYQNGSIKNHLQFIDGRPNGFQILYYQNGDTLEYGNFINGKWLGKYVSFYPNK